MKDFPRDTREFCRIGFNDACIYFRLQFSKYDFDTLVQCISDVKEYNDYRGATVAKAFERVRNYVDRASFGREGSPVLYLYLRRNYYDAARVEFVDHTPDEIAGMVREVKKSFSRAKVDEFYLMDEGHNDSLNVVRLWWD